MKYKVSNNLSRSNDTIIKLCLFNEHLFFCKTHDESNDAKFGKINSCNNIIFSLFYRQCEQYLYKYEYKIFMYFSR